MFTFNHEDTSFPRELVRMSVLGLEDELKTSTQNPGNVIIAANAAHTARRRPNPGELMMSLRRWLTAKYDWTGLSGTVLQVSACYCDRHAAGAGRCDSLRGLR